MVRHDELMSGQILQQEKTQSDLSARDCHLMDVLWLAGNQLRSLEGLDLPNLTELNAASNELSSVVGAFDELPQLKTLNLAGNRLCSFKEVLDLARRNSLTALSFADPDFGENPICTLCNYQTYILYHLPKLQVHDQMYVDAEAHQVAQAAYAKKRLYYNMRIKTLQRQSGDCLRAANIINEARRNTLGQDLANAAGLLRRAAAFQQSRKQNGGDEADTSEYQDLDAAERKLKLCEVELADAELAFQRLQQSVRQSLDAQIRCLLLELRSGGNVRFEKVEDTSQIRDLVMSRFRPQDFSVFNFSKIKVVQVTRLHHRSLHLHFEQLMERSETPEAFEYLFYVPEPRHALEELQEVAEGGLAKLFEKQTKTPRASSQEELDDIGIELQEDLCLS
ncbi:Leucine-rich repeat-containing protein 9 [Durusdinium trenchii]|uniref:Leucine-rich repeat-containing protein 9 n=1 Tax=Durusdinium trenchii TaxID=1381693 RepID=A0ABP0RLQ9_9DINO